MDPRNPKRPLDESGDNWARCAAYNCGRGATRATLIRHTKHCSGHSASPYADQGTLAERRAAENRPPSSGIPALRARLASRKAASLRAA
jgi:hypothetical protein